MLKFNIKLELNLRKPLLIAISNTLFYKTLIMPKIFKHELLTTLNYEILLQPTLSLKFSTKKLRVF